MFSFVMDRRREMEIRKVLKDYKNYSQNMHKGFGAIFLKVLRDIGLFEFLEQPRTSAEIVDKFNFTDQQYLNEVLNTLVDEKVLVLSDNKYQDSETLKQALAPEKLDVFLKTPQMLPLVEMYSQDIPNKLKGTPRRGFTDNKNLIKWDDMLKYKLYEDVRIATLIFGNALNRQGRFLDVGSGNGNGTMRIWSYYNDRHYFDPNSQKKIHIFAVDPDDNLRKMAENEFPLWLGKQLNLTEDNVKKAYGNTFPQFHKGTAHELPFEDNFFDIVYTSQSLHFDDIKAALKEMLRVVKPGGIVIGNDFYSSYVTIMCKVIEGAQGCLPTEEYRTYLASLNAKNIRLFNNEFIFFSYTK